MFLYIKSPFINYKIEFNNKITIIQGDSGTGKSKLVDSIIRFRTEKTSKIFTSNHIDIRLLNNETDWEHEVSNKSNKLFIVDEDADFVTSYKFAKLVNNSDNYFIIICRTPLKGLNYSYKDIFELRYSGKYNESIRKYKNYEGCSLDTNCQAILVEDSKSGFEFYKYHLGGNVRSLHGKAKVAQELVNVKLECYERIGLILDGAAIGSEMGDLDYIIKKGMYAKLSLFLPESVEEFIVNSNILNFEGVKREIKATGANKYTGKEEMYYKILSSETKDTPAHYKKNILSTCYTHDCHHKPESKCKFYSSVNKQEIVKELVFGKKERGDSNDKLLF